MFYMAQWGIADSLREPLMLAAINFGDKPDLVNMKLNFVARYIETFTVRRSINRKNFGQNSIKYTMFNVIKAIRSKELKELGVTLTAETAKMHSWDGIDDFILHGMNKWFVKHLLTRITCHTDKLAGKSTSYLTYQFPDGKPFEIEHIWADKFNDFKNEFDQISDFRNWRNSIGALLLLPRGVNQSLSDKKYAAKLKAYLKENTYAQTLHSDFYLNQPTFKNSPLAQELDFKAHTEFKKSDLLERQALVRRICEQIWSVKYFETVVY